MLELFEADSAICNQLTPPREGKTVRIETSEEKKSTGKRKWYEKVYLRTVKLSDGGKVG